MANKLSQEERDAMFAVYLETQSVNQVVEKCGKHAKTVNRYKELDKWDSRVAEISTEATKKADYSLAQARAEDIKIVRVLKGELVQALQDARNAHKRIFNLDADEKWRADFTKAAEMLIKLEMLLLGGATDRFGTEVSAPPTVVEVGCAVDSGGKETDE